MRSVVLSLLAGILLGCGSGSPTVPDRITPVWVVDLARMYRNNPSDHTFTGQLVQCQLEPDSYRLEEGEIRCLWMADPDRCCVRFRCITPLPEDSSRRLVVTGRCLGAIRDGLQRTPTTDFYVYVDECSVSALEP